MKQFDDKTLTKMVYISKKYLVDYDGEGIDEWDSVMFDPLNGWDINIWQESKNEPLSVVVYPVIEGKIITEVFHDITSEVLQ